MPLTYFNNLLLGLIPDRYLQKVYDVIPINEANYYFKTQWILIIISITFLKISKTYPFKDIDNTECLIIVLSHLV